MAQWCWCRCALVFVGLFVGIFVVCARVIDWFMGLL